MTTPEDRLTGWLIPPSDRDQLRVFRLGRQKDRQVISIVIGPCQNASRMSDIGRAQRSRLCTQALNPSH